MIIIGVGAGPRMLTQEAIEAIAEARLIYGSDRAIALVAEHISPGSIVKIIENYSKLRELPAQAVVLSTGDPMLSGLGYLEGRVIPGISSLQVACARLKISLLRVVPVTVHGRGLDPEAVAFELSRGKCVFLITDNRTDLPGLCSILESQGIRRAVTVLADLGYPEERITEGSTAAPPAIRKLSCVVIGDP